MSLKLNSNICHCFAENIVSNLCKLNILMTQIVLILLLQFFSISAIASDWYKDFGLEKNIVFSQKYNNSIIFYQTSKHPKKPSITLIHGVGGSAEDFKEIVEGLSQNYDLLLLDLPGFGLSKSHQDIFSPQKYANLLIDLLPEYINDTNYIIGHSMGGNVSVQIALQSPNLAKKLILIDAAGFLNKFSYSEHFAANYLSNKLPIAAQYSNILKSAISMFNEFIPDPTSILLSPMGRALILENDINSISAIAVMNENLSSLMRKKSPSTLIIWGKKDQVMPVQVSTMLSYLLDTQLVHIIPEAGHSPQKQYPTLIVDEIKEFINNKQLLPPPEIAIVNKAITVDCNKGDSLLPLNNTQFSLVTINNCQQGWVSHLHAKKITLNNSTISYSHLKVANDDDYSMILKNSEVEIWGGNLSGVSIAYIDNSKLEFNGVDLHAKNALVIGNLPTTINASLTKAQLNNAVYNWHGIIDIGL